jgi:hypothetical protein
VEFFQYRGQYLRRRGLLIDGLGVVHEAGQGQRDLTQSGAGFGGQVADLGPDT